MSWGFPASRAVAFGAVRSRCVHGSPAVSSCARTYSGQRPRSWTRLGGAFLADRSGRGSGSRRLTEQLAPRFRCPLSSVKSPSDSRKIIGGSRVWPTRGPRDPRALTRTLLIWGYRFGRTTAGGSPRLPGLRMGCRMQRPATDKPAPAGRYGASLRRPATDLGCTYGGPSFTSRDGTDNGERSKGTRYLLSPGGTASTKGQVANLFSKRDRRRRLGSVLRVRVLVHDDRVYLELHQPSCGARIFDRGASLLVLVAGEPVMQQSDIRAPGRRGLVFGGSGTRRG